MKNIFLSETICDYPFAGADLNGCHNDQEGLIKAITGIGVTLEQNTYRDAEPTHDKILVRILSFAQVMTDGTFTWHYSGHGTYGEDPLGTEPDGLREGLFPYDGKIVWDYELIEAFARFSRNVRVLIILDSCFSGGMSRLIGGDPLIRNRFYQTVSRPRGVRDRTVTEKINGVLLAGSGESQTSADAFISGKYWGAWSYHLTKALRQGMSSRLWYQSAYDSLVKARKFEQRPELLGVGDADAGLFGQTVSSSGSTNKGCLLKFLPS